MNGERQALLAAAGASALVVVAIVLGSRGLRDFDSALVHYAAAVVVAAGAAAYRTTLWAARPPARLYLKRALELVASGHASRAPRLAADRALAQRFIARRSRLRWVTHLCLSWGTITAFAITVPLVFGWIHFETDAHDAERWRAVVLGIETLEFSVDSAIAFAAFNALNVSALLVLAGVTLAVWRRFGEDRPAGYDLLPLGLLAAVAATGLTLTVSARWLSGAGYPAFALAHAATVIALLVYIPFGKLFHVLQRPVHVAVALYREAGAAGARAFCARCGAAFASALQVADLERLLVHYQPICPPCRRRLVALDQGRLLGR